MNQHLNFALIIILTFSIAAAQNCQSSPASDQLATGAHTFQLQPYTSRTQCFNTPLHAYFSNKRTQITAGINNVGQFQLDSSGIDFSLRSQLASSNSQASFTIVVNNGSWVSISIFYLVSARNDF